MEVGPALVAVGVVLVVAAVLVIGLGAFAWAAPSYQESSAEGPKKTFEVERQAAELADAESQDERAPDQTLPYRPHRRVFQ